jgi:hypothetical protein
VKNPALTQAITSSNILRSLMIGADFSTSVVPFLNLQSKFQELLSGQPVSLLCGGNSSLAGASGPSEVVWFEGARAKKTIYFL